MNTQHPLVSIIIPTFNRAHLIGETLDSVLAQTYTNWECIIVDDGSTDNTDEVVGDYVKKDPRFKYFHRPDTHKPGGNGARNYGFEVSEGEYVQWFDSDDIMLPDFLMKKLSLITLKTDIVICTGYSVDENLDKRSLMLMPKIDNLFKDYTLWKSQIMLPSVIFTKSFLKGKSLFNETLTRGQENEFFSRVFFKQNRDKYVVFPEGLYLYRQHNTTKSFEDKSGYKSTYKKSLGSVSLDNIERGIQLNDNEIINFHFRIVIHYLFEAIHKRDSKLGWFFLRKLISVFYNFDRLFVLKLVAWIPLFIWGGRTVYKVERRFKNKIFNEKYLID